MIVNFRARNPQVKHAVEMPKRVDFKEWIDQSKFLFLDYDRMKKRDLIIKASPIGSLIVAYMSISHYLALGVVCFAGTAWMFGYRTKAIELLIGVSLGYLVILHAGDFVSFLERISSAKPIL